MQFRILHSVLATSLVAFIALPAVAEDAGTTAEARSGSAHMQSATFDDVGMMTDPARTETTMRPDVRDGQLRLLALVGPVVAISVLGILGLTITLGALREDLRQRRLVNWPRGH